jgi:hypothetical protein
LIPIAFPRENPIPNSSKIHDRIHSRSQVDSRPYLLPSCRFSRLLVSVNYFTTRACCAMLLVNKQGDLSLGNESINYSLMDQSIKLACAVMLIHIPVTRIVIPIPFPHKNPLPHSRKIHGCIHSRLQVDPRPYLSSSYCFSRLSCSVNYFITRACNAIG